jgi:tetratricopeptide (TPR) repeat protein
VVAAAILFGASGCQAFKPFQQSMRTRVSAARQWTGNGLDAIRRGSLHEAKSCFNKAHSQLPEDHRIVANLARTHAQEGQYAEAIEQMQRAVDMSHGDPELRIELGEFYLAAGQIDLATEHAEKGISGNHRLASAWLLTGKIKAKQGDQKSAMESYQRALGIDGTREDVQLEIVKTYQRMNQPLRALSAVEQLLEKYPEERQPEVALVAKSTALLQLNQISPAIEVLEFASRRKDASEKIFADLAQAQLRAGRNNQAQETLARAQQSYPNGSLVAELSNRLSSESTRVAALDGIIR